MSEKTNIILGCAYGPGDLEPFFSSLRNLGPETAVVLFVSDLSAASERAARRMGVELRPFFVGSRYLPPSAENGWAPRLARIAFRVLRFTSRPRTLSPLYCELAKVHFYPNQARFFHYATFLASVGATYQRIMFTDVRDVVFQRDPFDFPAESEVVACEEHPTNRIGTNGYNRRWMLTTFGPRAVRRLGHHVVLCAGTILGGRSAILGYLDAFQRTSLSHFARHGADQAIHNYLVRERRVPSRVIPNGGGFVCNLDSVPLGQLRWDAAGQLLNSAGQPYSTVHMWDRIPAVASRVLAQYGAPQASEAVG